MKKQFTGLIGLLSALYLFNACGHDHKNNNAFIETDDIKCNKQAGYIICDDGEQYPLDDDALDEPIDNVNNPVDDICKVKENKRFIFIKCGRHTKLKTKTKKEQT